MFLKQYNYKPRTGSESSQGGVDRTDSAARADSSIAKNEASTPAGAVTGAIAGRRRSSDVTGKFSGLHSHKRNSQDADAAERKANWADQKPGQGGILSGMWTNFTKGK